MRIPAPPLLLLLLQVPLVMAILAFVPTNLGKLGALLVLWALSFGRLTRVEAVFFAVVCVFFTGMNAASLAQGIFAFTEPDLLRMPVSKNRRARKVPSVKPVAQSKPQRTPGLMVSRVVLVIELRSRQYRSM